MALRFSLFLLFPIVTVHSLQYSPNWLTAWLRPVPYINMLPPNLVPDLNQLNSHLIHHTQILIILNHFWNYIQLSHITLQPIVTTNLISNSNSKFYFLSPRKELQPSLTWTLKNQLGSSQLQAESVSTDNCPKSTLAAPPPSAVGQQLKLIGLTTNWLFPHYL